MDTIIKDKLGIANIKLIFIYFISGLIAHIGLWEYRVAHNDTVMAGLFYYTADWETTLGRWLIHFVDYLKYYICAPYFSGIISVFFISVSIVIIINIFEITDFVLKIILGLLFMMTPCISHTLMFYYCSDSYSLSLLFACVFVYFIKKKSSCVNFLLATFFIVLSLGLYQAYIGTAAALCVSLLILYILQKENIVFIIKKAIYMFFSAGAGLVIYYIIALICLKMYDLKFASYGGADSLGSTSISNIKNAIALSYINFKELMWGFMKNNYHHFYRSSYYVTVVFTISIAVMFYIIIHNCIYKDLVKITGIVFLFGIYPLACGIILIVVKNHNLHILMRQGYYVIFILFGAIVNIFQNTFPNKKYSMYISAVFSISLSLFVFELFAVNNATYEYNNLKRNNIVSTANRILSHAENLDGYNKDIEFVFAGHLDSGYAVDSYIEKMAMHELGMFYSELYDQNKTIIEHIYKDYLACPVNMADDMKYVEIVSSDDFKYMPAYPETGYMKIIDDCILVKLEDNVPMPEGQ